MHELLAQLIGNSDFYDFECKKNFVVVKSISLDGEMYTSADYSYEFMNRMFDELGYKKDN